MPEFANLFERQFRLPISEPWEFATRPGTDEIRARITEIRRELRASPSGQRETELAVLRVERPFAYRNLKCEYLLASPRHEGFGFADVEAKNIVAFNFSRISSEQASSDDPFDLTRWRNQPTFEFIGTITPEPR